MLVRLRVATEENGVKGLSPDEQTALRGTRVAPLVLGF